MLDFMQRQRRVEACESARFLLDRIHKMKNHEATTVDQILSNIILCNIRREYSTLAWNYYHISSATIIT